VGNPAGNDAAVTHSVTFVIVTALPVFYTSELPKLYFSAVKKFLETYHWSLSMFSFLILCIIALKWFRFQLCDVSFAYLVYHYSIPPTLLLLHSFTHTHTHTQAFYGPFSGTTQVSLCQKRTSGLYGARED